MPRTPPLRTRALHVAGLMLFVSIAWAMIFGPLIFLSGRANPALPPHLAGLTANRALPVLVQLEEREGDLVIAEHAGNEAAIDLGLDAVEARWAPFWAAWEAFVHAQRAWADAVLRKEPGAAIAAAERLAVAAFCAARQVLPSTVPPELLDAPGVPCHP